MPATTHDKQILARFNQTDDVSAGMRLRAARKFAGMTQADFGTAIGVVKTAIANMEGGRSFPSKDAIAFLFYEHRIDANFIMFGHYAQLPGDVQDKLFEGLRRS